MRVHNMSVVVEGGKVVADPNAKFSTVSPVTPQLTLWRTATTSLVFRRPEMGKEQHLHLHFLGPVEVRRI